MEVDEIVRVSNSLRPSGIEDSILVLNENGPGSGIRIAFDFLTTSWIEFSQFDPAPGCLGWNQAMKELGVIATLIALGFGTSNSVAYVFNQSCRMMEAYDEEVANQSAIAAVRMHKEALGMQISCRSLSALE